MYVSSVCQERKVEIAFWVSRVKGVIYLKEYKKCLWSLSKLISSRILRIKPFTGL